MLQDNLNLVMNAASYIRDAGHKSVAAHSEIQGT